jgi:hypothetical protein
MYSGMDEDEQPMMEEQQTMAQQPAVMMPQASNPVMDLMSKLKMKVNQYLPFTQGMSWLGYGMLIIGVVALVVFIYAMVRPEEFRYKFEHLKHKLSGKMHNMENAIGINEVGEIETPMGSEAAGAEPMQVGTESV